MIAFLIEDKKYRITSWLGVLSKNTGRVSPDRVFSTLARLEPVHLFSKDRQPTPVGTSALLFLALSVFAWGLQYKLSLYDPPQSLARQVPTAKLLSRDEQPEIASSATVASPQRAAQAVMPIALGILLLLVYLTAPARAAAVHARRLEADRSWKLQLTPCKTFFVRPPPFSV